MLLGVSSFEKLVVVGEAHVDVSIEAASPASPTGIVGCNGSHHTQVKPDLVA